MLSTVHCPVVRIWCIILVETNKEANEHISTIEMKEGKKKKKKAYHWPCHPLLMDGMSYL